MNKIILSEYVRIVFKSPEGESYFFGYYNIPQLDAKNEKLLAQRVQFEDRPPDNNDKAEIGYFSLLDGKWNKIGVSKAFNWQQGCNLQWLGPDFSNNVIYNDIESDRFVTRIFSVRDEKIKTWNFPSYSVDKSGSFSITINYNRAFWTRAYSYEGIKDHDLNKNITAHDGFYRLNLKTGELGQIFNLKNWLETNQGIDLNDTWHWTEHPILNLKGNLVFGYYRYGSIEKYETIGLILDTENGNVIHQVELNQREDFSHMGWNFNDEIALYVTPRKAISDRILNSQKETWTFRFILEVYRRLIKPLVPRKIIQKATNIDSFYRIYCYKDGQHRNILKKELTIDGHPSFTLDGLFMLTDTYQDENNYRNLYLIHLETQKLFLLGKFYSHVNNYIWRSDLHPRFSQDEKYIIIDSNTSGFHQIILLKIEWKKIYETLKQVNDFHS